MRILFLGSPDYAVPSLKAVHASGHEIAGVVTQPPRRAGRGKKVTPTAVAAAARELAIEPVIETGDINAPEIVRRLRELWAEALVTIAFGQMLKEPVLELAPRGAINAHGSLLPRHRGASPVQAAIIAGDDLTGVTITRMVQKMDAGPIIAQDGVRLTGTETGESLHDELAEMSASMLPEALDDIEAGVAAEMPQDDSQATYCRLIRKSDGVIDFTRAAGHLERKVRAYHPWPGAFTVLPLSSGGSERATLTRVEVAGGDGEPGEVIGAEGGRLEIACGVGSLRVLDLRPAGKRAMTAAEFLRGHHVEEGGLACAPR